MPTCSVDGCSRSTHGGGRGWCKAHYMRWFQTGDVRAHVPLRLHNVDPQLRFWPKVDKAGPTPATCPEKGPCWLWTGQQDRNGYGLFAMSKRQVGAHRFAFEASGQQIPDGLEIDHLCRNRSCVNPQHLEPVTHEENMRRAYVGLTHCRNNHLLSEDNIRFSRSGGRICVACARKGSVDFLERRATDPDAPRCSAEGCEYPSRTRGWCGTHYARWLRYGDIEGGTGRVANGTWRDATCSVDGCESQARAKGWCNRHYAKWRQHGDAQAPDKQASAGTPLRQRIEGRIEREGSCWIWQGKIQVDGYGRLNVQGAGRTVHRIAYEVYVGPIPTGVQIDQSCGDRRCVNPEHLLAVQRVTIAKRP